MVTEVAKLRKRFNDSEFIQNNEALRAAVQTSLNAASFEVQQIVVMQEARRALALRAAAK